MTENPAVETDGFTDLMCRKFGDDVVAYLVQHDPHSPDLDAATLIERAAENDREEDDEVARARSGFDLRALLMDATTLRDLPVPAALIEGTLVERTVALLAGRHGTGKSFVALDWACSIATGADWQGRKTKRGRVLYVSGEGVYGIHDRLTAWSTDRKVEIEHGALTVVNGAVQLADPHHLAQVVSLCTREHFDLVIVDTLARASVGLDENSAQEMGRVIAAVDAIKAALDGGTVLLVHHTGKAGAVRGSSALEAAVDVAYMTEGDPTAMKLKRTKMKDGPLDDVVLLALVPVGPSAVLKPQGESGVAEVRVATLGRPAVAFRALHKAFRTIGEFTGTDGLKVVMDTHDISRTIAYGLLDDLVTAGALSLEKRGRSNVYTLHAAEAVAVFGVAVTDHHDPSGEGRDFLPR